MNRKLLKTTQFTKIQPIEANDIHVANVDLVSSKITTICTIGSVDLKSFNNKLICTSCKSEDLEKEDPYVICNSCGRMASIEKSLKQTDILFTVEDGAKRGIDLTCKPSIVENCFFLCIKKKILLAKTMMASKLNVTYDSRDN